MFVGAPHYNTATCVGRRKAAKPFNIQRESCFAELVLGDPVIRSANKGLKDNIPCPLQHMRQYPLSVSVLATRACLRYFVSPDCVMHIPLAVSNFLSTFLKVEGEMNWKLIF